MLRKSMGDQSLVQLFNMLGKPVNKSNAHELAAVACAAPEIFMAPALGPLRVYMASDCASMYCYSRGIPRYTAYGRLVSTVLQQYTVAEFISASTLRMIFEALDSKIIDIQTTLDKDGFPPLE